MNIEKASLIVCRNKAHLSQVKSLFQKTIPEGKLGEMSVEELVEFWWKEQLFLCVKVA